MALVFLGLGSNKGNRLAYLLGGLENIKRDIGAIQTQSSVYQTAAWGFFSETDFYNMVVSVLTELSPEDLLRTCELIEKKAGREKKTVRKEYQNRTLDLDILFYDSMQVASHNLVIPHPKIEERKFVLVPLNEIAPDWEHPVLKKKIKELLDTCSDKMEVTKIH
ncbi:MAG: 2-amino-4-hydroxy-6-hydroxymethyldihydropteridine diphosphokinase [Paludibacteraceae bacterium]|nr:2-amino-4-hydroxy-6-hydroxymethyldihydropteridine diphosphokinase [Paludibacteraceae bacterium]